MDLQQHKKKRKTQATIRTNNNSINANMYCIYRIGSIILIKHKIATKIKKIKKYVINFLFLLCKIKKGKMRKLLPCKNKLINLNHQKNHIQQ